VAGSCKYDDDRAGSGATGLVIFQQQTSAACERAGCQGMCLNLRGKSNRRHRTCREVLHSLYSSPDIMRRKKSRRL
jgi:hypothetical protein